MNEIETIIAEWDETATGFIDAVGADSFSLTRDPKRIVALIAALRMAIKQRNDGIANFYENEPGVLADEKPHRTRWDINVDDKEVLAALAGL